jgi:hypothetical protein
MGSYPGVNMGEAGVFARGTVKRASMVPKGKAFRVASGTMRTISSQGTSSVPARIHWLHPCLLSGINGELGRKCPEYIT